MVNTAKVSIVIPCYNYWHYIEETIESCLDWSPAWTEIIVVDDCSPDQNTRAKLSTLKNEYQQIKWVFLDQNGWVSRARNIWISKASWEYILCIDADDLLNPGTIARSIEILENDPECDFVYGDYQMFWISNELIEVPEFNEGGLFFKNYIHPASVFRKKIWETVWGFDENRRNKFEDWDFWLMAVSKWFVGKKGSFVGVKYRQHSDSRNVEAVSRYFTNMLYLAKKHKSARILANGMKGFAIRSGIKLFKRLWAYDKLSRIWRKYVLKK